MDIIIIEDELQTSMSLENTIMYMKPETNILGTYRNVDDSVEALSEGLRPDLICMDMQLANSSIIEKLKIAGITCPLILCTSYNEFPVEEYKGEKLSYLLKIFNNDGVNEAIKKIEELKTLVQQKTVTDYLEPSHATGTQRYKSSYLVFRNQKYTTIKTENIAFFYIKNNYTSMMCFDKQEYVLNQSLDQIVSTVSPNDFFRINRQYLINFQAIKEVEHYLARKLHVKLVIETADRLLINKEKTQNFLSWMDNR